MTNMSNANSERIGVPHVGTNQALFGYWRSKHIQPKADLALQSGELLNPIVQISPAELVNRLGTGGHGWFTESIHVPVRTKIEFRFQGAVHLLIMYNEGARRDGETSIEGLAPSKARNLVNKLTFAPAGRAYREWHETGAATRVTFLYLDPANLQKADNTNALYLPRIIFEDSIVWETAAKLKSAIESGQAKSPTYLEALSSVLAHELSRPDHEIVRDSSVNRGGLASWQKRVVVGYIEENLGEQVSLVTLAQLARLSQHHFCRAFKQSFGIPPHHYHVHRRIERAKLLLADRTISVTDVGFIVGYHQTSSFSVAFRKVTGWTPTEYRREFK